MPSLFSLACLYCVQASLPDCGNCCRHVKRSLWIEKILQQNVRAGPVLAVLLSQNRQPRFPFMVRKQPVTIPKSVLNCLRSGHVRKDFP
jgi:hypothetical protein